VIAAWVTQAVCVLAFVDGGGGGGGVFCFVVIPLTTTTTQKILESPCLSVYVCVWLCQGHGEGLCNQNLTVSVLFSKLMILLQPN